MKNNKKLTLLSSLAALIAVAGVGTIGANAEGVAKPEALTSFVMQQATSVRTTAPYGIRFTATLSEAEYTILQNYEAENPDSVEYGMLIIPTDLIPAGEALDCDDEVGTLKESGTQDIYGDLGEPDEDPSNDVIVTPDTNHKDNYEKIVAEPIYDETTGTYSITGGIKGVLPNNFSRPFTARAYVLVAGTYFYTETWERSIYTAATYAESNLEEGSEQHTYFTETVIGAVEETYNQSRVEISTPSGELQYNLARVGEEITAKGYVYRQIGTNEDGTPKYRELESKATLTDANLKYVSGGKYTVKNFTGDTPMTLTANVGANDVAGQTVEVKEKYGKDIKAWAESNPALKWGDKANPFTYVEEFQGKKDVLHWETVDVASARYFTDRNLLSPEVGKYYAIDVWFSRPTYLEFSFYYNGTKQSFSDAWTAAFYDVLAAKGQYDRMLTNPVTGVEETVTVFKWRALKADGTELAKPIHDKGYKQWLTLEFYFPENPDYNFDLRHNGFAFYFIGTADNENYIANPRVLDYAIEPTYLADFVPEEELKEEYAQEESVGAFNLIYKDTIGRVVKTKKATDATIEGYASYDANNEINLMWGDATISYTLDSGEMKSYEVKGADVLNIPYTSIVKGYGYYSTVNANSKVAYEDEFMGATDVAHFSNATSVAAEWGATFAQKYLDAIPTGAYLYYEIWINKNVLLLTDLYGNTGGDRYLDKAKQKTYVSAYNAAGTAITANGNPTAYIYTAQFANWFTVEYREIPVALTKKAVIGGFGENYGNSAIHAGIRNVRVSTERLSTLNDAGKYVLPMEEKPVEQTIESMGGQLDLLKSAKDWGLYLNHHVKASKYFSTTTEEIGGVPAGQAFKWNNTITKKGLLMNTATFRIVNPLSKDGADKSWGQSYFYIDLYLEGKVNISFNAGWDGDHNIKAMQGATSQVDTYVKSVKAYDLTPGENYGQELANVNLTLPENQGKWIRLEVLTNGKADKQTVSTSSEAHMRFCNGWYFDSFETETIVDDKGTPDDTSDDTKTTNIIANAYFKNPMIRTTKWNFNA